MSIWWEVSTVNKLLNGSFTRLWKNKVFWVEMAVMPLWTAIMLISKYYDTVRVSELNYSLDDFIFRNLPYMGALCAIFTSLFLGTDYSDGTIRNKLVVGHSRQALYLSNAIVCVAAGIMVHAAWILSVLAIGVPLFGWFEGGTLTFLTYLLVSVFMLAALASILTMISMLVQSKAASAVITLLVFFLLVALAGFSYNRLSEPEMNSSGIEIRTTDSGDVEYIQHDKPVPNPNYVSGNLRKALEFIVNFLPTGQGILLSVGKAAQPLLMPLYSLIVTMITLVAGIMLFRRKDLK